MTDITIPDAARPTRAVNQITAIEQARAVEEVRAAVVVAQQCPRDLGRAEGEMRDACGRLALANRAFYRVPNRGNGPSVHLARELARIWGNVQYGVHELRRDDDAGMSEVQAFAWDVQTNTRSTRTFQVPHQRMKSGKRVPLTDLGDVYLNNQNIGARAVRECVFTVLPTWFTEAAEQLCHQTLENGEGTPLPERIDKMAQAFATKHGIKAAQLEAKIGRKRGQWDAGDVATMQVLWQSIERGEVTVSEEFPPTVAAAEFTTPTPAPVDDITDAEEVHDEPTDPMQGGEDFPAEQNRLNAMFAEFGRAGFTTDARSAEGRKARLDYCSNILGRPVESSKDMSAGQVERVINALKVDGAEDRQ